VVGVERANQDANDHAGGHKQRCETTILIVVHHDYLYFDMPFVSFVPLFQNREGYSPK
jgi:ABC-type lipopolysaccharide export system ATPase subunit